MADIALRLDHISRHFGKVRAVDDLSLDIPSGSFVTLLGPSGCGKSTTLSLIAGLDRLDGGTILLGDEDITETPPNERRMAMVFQNYALYPHMTVYDNIAFGLKLQHRPKAEVDVAGRGGRRDPRHRPSPAAQAGPAVGRPAAARGARPRARQGARSSSCSTSRSATSTPASAAGCGPRSSTSTSSSAPRASSSRTTRKRR